MFATKAYTIQYFIDLFEGTTSRNLTRHGVYNVVSPRKGYDSVRAEVLDYWLGNQTNFIVNGTGKFSTFGASQRSRLLKALRLRKTNGSVFV
jgi:hypothetical protein